MKTIEDLDIWYEENLPEFDAEQIEVIDFLVDTAKEYFIGFTNNKIPNLEDLKGENRNLKKIIKVLEEENVRLVDLKIDKETSSSDKRKILVERLNLCNAQTIKTFKRLYGGTAIIPDHKLDRAIIQVEKALETENRK